MLIADLRRDFFKRLTLRKMDRFYENREDPYRFRTSRFNVERMAAMDAALSGRVYMRALELGASQGDYTERLAMRAERVVAVEVSSIASARARERLSGLRNVDWVYDDIRTWSPGKARFDLIVLADILYYLDKPLIRSEFERTFERVASWLSDSGRLLLVNGFLGEQERRGRLSYRERFESLGLRLAMERVVAIDPREEPVQCFVSLLERKRSQTAP